MLVSEFVEVNLTKSMVKYYESLGYEIPKHIDKQGRVKYSIGEKILVKVSDMSTNSEYKVLVKCDYCGEVIEKLIRHFKKGRVKVKKDACGKSECQHKKMNDVCDFDYGVPNYQQLKHVKKKGSDTLRSKTYSDKVKWFEDRDLILLTTKEEFFEVFGNELILKFACKIHSEEIQYVKNKQLSQRKVGCELCYRKERTEEMKCDFNDVKSCFENRGYILIDTEYINAQTHMKYICKKHPNSIRTINYNHLSQGKGCRECYLESKRKQYHWNWRGGISNLNLHLRTLLETDWKVKSLEKYDYKCVVTGIHSELEVHHIISFNSIINKVLKELNFEIKDKIGEYTIEELTAIEKLFFKYHYENLGVPLLPEVHKLFHKIYGRGNNTKEQFEEFIIRFDNHEFDKDLKIFYKIIN